jgi:peptidoglycan-N-acetylglucosamine deacetylase
MSVNDLAVFSPRRKINAVLRALATCDTVWSPYAQPRRSVLSMRRNVTCRVLVAASIAVLAACGTSQASPAAVDASQAPAPVVSVDGVVPEPVGEPSAQASGSSPATKPSATKPSPSRTPSATPETAPRPRPPLSELGPGDSVRGTGSAAVALTFDDGPDPVNTPLLLDELQRYGVKATFCVVGSRARDYPDVIKRIVRDGHTLCNHSWQHLSDLALKDDGYLWWDLRSTNEAIRTAVPNAKIAYFRAPYGKFTPRLTSFTNELGMKPIYWDVDDECYQTPLFGTGQQMQNRMATIVHRDTRPGSIILSHDNKKPFTARAYQTILPQLKARFRLIALPA